jgi:predicted enzyme related to lactoylglutathione lyase
MSDIGKIGWIDITVDDAAGLRDFYVNVTGWEAERVDMGDCSDFTITMPGSGTPVAALYQSP